MKVTLKKLPTPTDENKKMVKNLLRQAKIIGLHRHPETGKPNVYEVGQKPDDMPAHGIEWKVINEETERVF